MSRSPLVFTGDFETTVYDGQTFTEVWASAVVQLGTEDVKIFHSIGETFDYFKSLKRNIIVYYHNLKFDGSFWLPYLMQKLNYKQAYVQSDKDDINTITWLDDKEMKNNTFKYVISSMGQWYSITIRTGGHTIELRDSLKLLPFTVKKIGTSFGTKHKKLDMEYTGYRYAGCEITEEEREYIANDVLVVKEALEIMFNEKHNKLTIGSCCLTEYKKSIGGKNEYDIMFPDVYDMELDESIYGSPNVGEYIHNSYRGGWCYVVPHRTNTIVNKGITADVNSLYPSMMSSESGNVYPIGEPTFWSGNYIPDEAYGDINGYPHYFFVRIRTRFYLKENYLPFIQLKHNLMYNGREMLETSDIKNEDTGIYYPQYIGLDGKRHEAIVEMTLTMTDFKLLKEHYDLVDFEILDGCWFYAQSAIFDIYMGKYRKIKAESKGAKRELAKLFLNNLYGKMASSKNSSFKVARVRDDGSLGFYTVIAYDKKAGYIPVGSAITSYARNFTIRTAQMNYHGEGERGFIYADTDSIHCDLEPNELKGVKVHPSDFCCWKLESTWDKGIFVRPKTYIEYVVQEDLVDCEPYYNVKCAGMPKHCKDLFEYTLPEHYDKGEAPPFEPTEEESKFLANRHELTDFKIGLCVPSKLRPVRIKGGVLLVPTTYQMR